jgi:hypothetical protein
MAIIITSMMMKSMRVAYYRGMRGGEEGLGYPRRIEFLCAPPISRVRGKGNPT